MQTKGRKDIIYIGSSDENERSVIQQLSQHTDFKISHLVLKEIIDALTGDSEARSFLTANTWLVSLQGSELLSFEKTLQSLEDDVLSELSILILSFALTPDDPAQGVVQRLHRSNIQVRSNPMSLQGFKSLLLSLDTTTK